MTILTADQEEELKSLSSYLDTQEAQNWMETEVDSLSEIKQIVQEAAFQEGKNLSASQLNAIFHHMRIISANRALARNLYESIGLHEFNEELRNLLYSKDPLPDKFNQFINIPGVGTMTASHFLCVFFPSEYPLVTHQTYDMLELNPYQEDKAEEQALKEFEVLRPEDYHGRTIRFLRDFVIFREVKELLGLDSFTSVNKILWKKYRQEETSDELEGPTFVSVSLEKDLRRYLAENPSEIASGATLVKEQYRTEAGEIDLLLKDRDDTFIVVETKKGRPNDSVVGQILRYVGYIMRNESKRVKGVIVTAESSDRLDYALESLNNVSVKYYRVRFELSDVPFTS